MTTIFSYAYELCNKLGEEHPLVGVDYDFDGNKELVPVMNGKFIWDCVPSVQLPEELVTEYTNAFNSITEWKTEFHVTREGYMATEISRGKNLGSHWVPEQGYDKVVPVIGDEWTLPVQPKPAMSKEDSLRDLLVRAKGIHLQQLEQQLKEQVWGDWILLAEAELARTKQSQETKVMWFSRHDMTSEQHQALVDKLGPISVTKINGTAPNVHVPFEGEVNGCPQTIPPLKELVNDHDVIAVVAPIGLQQQFLSIANNKPVIMTENAREFDDEGKVSFRFVRWFRLVRIEVETEDFAS